MTKLLAQLKSEGQDFEFYPTTDEIISALIRSIGRTERNGFHSFLDIGAGNGKVLKAVKDRAVFTELYAIEKSIPLCKLLDDSVFIVGTEFHEQSLMAKKVDITFCNPPYSEFEEWAVKIIRESSSRFVYLVLPVRWKESRHISDALKYREAKTIVSGDFSFEDAEDRTARAIVHLIRIELSTEKDDAFDRFFDEQFAELKAKFESTKEVEYGDDKGNVDREEENRFSALTVGANYPERLVELYNAELDHIRKNYELVAKLDTDLLKEFDVTPKRILGCLKARLEGLRNIYWKELFDHMGQITNRLTTSKRRIMLDKLNETGHVDFTHSNIYAVVLWVLKNANRYLDSQLTETFEKMVEQANVRNYTSNKRVFEGHNWRYNEKKPTHVALEYRLVLQHCGGIEVDYDHRHKLSDTASEFLRDMLTVARNLGFECDTTDQRLNYHGKDQWRSRTLQEFECVVDGKRETLMEVRAYLNWNIHIRLNQKFALALNVEHGRLKGWITNGQEAADELGDKDAPKYFQRNARLGTGSLPMLAAFNGTAPKEELQPA